METQEQTAEQPVAEGQPSAERSAAAQQFQAAVERLGQLTISLMQGREELAEKERQAAALEAEITGLRLRIEAGEKEALRAQGAAGALQALVQAETQEGGGDAN